MHRKVVKTSKLACKMSLVQGQTAPIGLLAVLGSQGIVVKCTAALFFCLVNWSQTLFKTV